MEITQRCELCLCSVHVEKHIDFSPGNNALHDDNYLNSVLKVTYTLFWWHCCHYLSLHVILWRYHVWMIHLKAEIELEWPGNLRSDATWTRNIYLGMA